VGTVVPAGLKDSIFGEDPGFVDLQGRDFHLRADSALIDAGLGAPKWLDESLQLAPAAPECEPTRNGSGPVARARSGRLDIGAFEYAVGGQPRGG